MSRIEIWESADRGTKVAWVKLSGTAHAHTALEDASGRRIEAETLCGVDRPGVPRQEDFDISDNPEVCDACYSQVQAWLKGQREN